LAVLARRSDQRANVGRLELVWKYDTGISGQAFEASAIVFDDRIHITTPGNNLVRLDPATRKPGSAA
jgi:glucose dehydrogenase